MINPEFETMERNKEARNPIFQDERNFNDLNGKSTTVPLQIAVLLLQNFSEIAFNLLLHYINDRPKLSQSAQRPPQQRISLHQKINKLFIGAAFISKQ